MNGMVLKLTWHNAQPGRIVVLEPTPGDLLRRRAHFVQYLKDRTAVEDWHGVMDAAADLREIDAALKVLG